MTRTRTKAKVMAEAEAAGALRAVLGAVLLAATLYAVLAAPGVISDRDSTAPAGARESRGVFEVHVLEAPVLPRHWPETPPRYE